MNTFLLVDGNSLLHRAFHALPAFKTYEGVPTNAVYGFMTMLHKTIEDFKPSYVAICFDTPAPTFRNKLFKDYQSHRAPVSDDLIPQFSLIREVLETAGIRYYEKDGVEADDLIGTATAKLKNKKFRVLILTGDRDMMQLVDKNTNLISPKLGIGDIILYGPKEVGEKFGVSPESIADYKALVGDPSDNYGGVGGIGPTTASGLIAKYGSLEEIYKKIGQIDNQRIKQKLINDKKQAFLSKKLATILHDVKFDFDIEDCRFIAYNDKLKEEFEKLQFKSLLNRLFKKKLTEKQTPEKPQKQMDLF